jgi:formylglycine-generating enzyme required for sulfatase activity
MSEKEITRAQFLAIMKTDPSDTSRSSGMNDPVQMVNWYHAIAFCNKLSIAEGLDQVYSVTGIDFSNLAFNSIPIASDSTWNAATADWSANGYRLPTEMEWMWAAMGAVDDYTKPFAGSDGSNVIGDYAVFGFNGFVVGRTTTKRSDPVGSKLPNELGLYDMSGNVAEWNWDWYAGTPPNYAITGTVTDYRGAASGSKRVTRGCDWNTYASGCTVADRFGDDPKNQYDGRGFRVVRP